MHTYNFLIKCFSASCNVKKLYFICLYNIVIKQLSSLIFIWMKLAGNNLELKLLNLKLKMSFPYFTLHSVELIQIHIN